MTRQLLLHDEALAEIRSAAQWYEERRRGLGKEFLDALDVRLERLVTSPNVPRLGGNLPGADPRGPFRRVLLARFPYVIVFLESPGTLRVLAVMHGRRSPGYWMQRLPP
ncbi:MAG: type II toxin-antitoxin system RelE/ParE family toxin [Polyangiaceae bacterium]|nr:type II toxin-antitoxin system RelE/ParE family toxin [Polyangiaceae bacterium]